MTELRLPGEEKEKSSYRILVVDDDPEVQEITRAAFEKEGFTVWVAGSAEEALSKINDRGLPHLAVVDIVLPGLDGLGFCQKLHEFCDVPVIMLTVVNEEETVVESIERFAEDYVKKPFNPSELIARVRRLLRRIGDFSYTLDPVVEVDEHLSVDFVRQLAIVDERPVALTPTETKLLFLLMRQSGQTVRTDFILGRLWTREEADENTLRVHVHRLRQKIENAPSRPRYVLTERGAGYSFLHSN